MQAKLVAVVLRPDPPFVPARQIIILHCCVLPLLASM
jgi:hypothetical protein